MEEVKITFTLNDEEGTIKGEIEGKTKVPFWNHDLKMRTAINLLNTVDEKDFKDQLEFEKLLSELKETVSSFRV